MKEKCKKSPSQIPCVLYSRFLYTLRKKQGAKAGKFQNGLTLTNRRKCFIMVSEHEVSRDSLSPKNRSIRKEIKMDFDRNTRTTISKECRDTDGIATTVGERFFKIWDFMVFDFKLEKTELYVYAIIFAMHKNYNQGFKGSRAYLAKWSNCSLRTVATALRSLATKGYIDKVHKKIDGKVRPVYFINVEKLPTCKVFSAENYARDTWQRFKKEREEAGEIFDRKIIYDFA